MEMVKQDNRRQLHARVLDPENFYMLHFLIHVHFLRGPSLIEGGPYWLMLSSFTFFSDHLLNYCRF